MDLLSCSFRRWLKNKTADSQKLETHDPETGGRIIYNKWFGLPG
jgi:hypothetical protein